MNAKAEWKWHLTEYDILGVPFENCHGAITYSSWGSWLFWA